MMRCTAVLLLLGSASAVRLTESYVHENHGAMWESFKRDHNRKYNDSEEKVRHSVFVENMLQAAKSQAANPLATFGVNKFADFTAEEFKVRHSLSLGQLPTRRGKKVGAPKVDSWDWRDHGAVTAVKDQAHCGSCWSFSVTGAIEGAWKVAGNSLVALSEQELVSCDTDDSGCNGGNPVRAMAYIYKQWGGQVQTEESYPYTAGAGDVAACNKTGKKIGATITGGDFGLGANLVDSNETEIASALAAHSTLSIAVDATAHWQTYTGGIVSNCNTKNLDHGVLLVAFGTDSGTDYWTIKNSWGPSWGESGYIRIARGGSGGAQPDQCGMSSLVSYPTAKAA